MSGANGQDQVRISGPEINNVCIKAASRDGVVNGPFPGDAGDDNGRAPRVLASWNHVWRSFPGPFSCGGFRGRRQLPSVAGTYP